MCAPTLRHGEASLANNSGKGELGTRVAVRGQGLTRDTHTFVVLQRRALEDEKPRLPTAEVLAPFGEVAFFVPWLQHRLLRLPDDVRCEKRDSLIIVLDRECYERAQIVLKRVLRKGKSAIELSFNFVECDVWEIFATVPRYEGH